MNLIYCPLKNLWANFNQTWPKASLDEMGERKGEKMSLFVLTRVHHIVTNLLCCLPHELLGRIVPDGGNCDHPADTVLPHPPDEILKLLKKRLFQVTQQQGEQGHCRDCLASKVLDYQISVCFLQKN